jgi:hypothetical protein
MDTLWIQIAVAAVLGMMLFFLFPAAKHWWTQGPRAAPGDWSGALLPLALVVGFVVLLVLLVR